MNITDKIIDFLGDSITEGTGVSDKDNRYDMRLKKEFSLKEIHNYGIGGTRLAHQIKPSAKPRYDLCFCGRAYNLDPDADIIVVYGGVNDYLHGDAPFGTMEDKTPSTFCGAVYFLMNFIKTTYRDKVIIFMTPAHCYYNDTSDSEVSRNLNKQPDAKPLQAYVDVIKARGEELGIPVLDLMQNLGIDPNNKEEREKYTIDGLHFNDDGHKFIAKALGEFLTGI